VRRGLLFVFLGPAFSIMFFVALVPFIFAIVLSLLDLNLLYSSNAKFVGLKNFVQLFHDGRFINALKNSALFVTGSVLLELLLGLILSYIIYVSLKNSTKRNLLILLITFPMMFPRVTSALLWRFLYNPLFSPLGNLFQKVGITFAPLSSPRTALFAVIVADVWQWTSFFILILLSGLEALPVSLFEAATVDGATENQRFWYIALPLLKPIIWIAAMFRIIDALRTFDTIYVMTGGGPGIATETLDIFAYLIGISQGGRISYATAAAIILLIASVIISNILVKFFKEGEI
jgi:multiple sugar transport system permease protein